MLQKVAKRLVGRAWLKPWLLSLGVDALRCAASMGTCGGIKWRV